MLAQSAGPRQTPNWWREQLRVPRGAPRRFPRGFLVSKHRFDVDFDTSATRQSDRPGGFVTNPILECACFSVAHCPLRFFDHGPFEAPAGDRTNKCTIFAHGNLTACLARCRTPRFDDSAERNLATVSDPLLRG